MLPLGVVVAPEGFDVTYGKNSNSTRLLRNDRAKLAVALQLPVPASVGQQAAEHETQGPDSAAPAKHL